MEGRRLREFAFQCFIAARGSYEPIVRDDYRALAARLVQRANEKDGLIPSVVVTKQAPKVGPPDGGTEEGVSVPRSK
jgi:hypothetical protein